jgi:hypothetical protein
MANSAAPITILFYLFISGGFFGELAPVAGGEYTPHSYIGSYFSLVLNIRDRTTNIDKIHIFKIFMLREMGKCTDDVRCGRVDNYMIFLFTLNKLSRIQSAWKTQTMDQITIKTPNPKCRLYWCLIEFIDWRYRCWYFRPLL